MCVCVCVCVCVCMYDIGPFCSLVSGCNFKTCYEWGGGDFEQIISGDFVSLATECLFLGWQ